MAGAISQDRESCQFPSWLMKNPILGRAARRESGQGFLHISKPEIDLPVGTDPYSPAVYAKAAENLARMLDAGVLARDRVPSYYVYRITTSDQVQTGGGVAASLAAYDANRIRKHEDTRPDKEDDRPS